MATRDGGGGGGLVRGGRNGGREDDAVRGDGSVPDFGGGGVCNNESCD